MISYSNLVSPQTEPMKFVNLLTPGAHLVYSYLVSRPNRIVGYKEFTTIGIKSRKSNAFNLSNYIAQVRRVTGAKIYNVHGVGYMLINTETL